MPIDDELEKSSFAVEIREESERTIQNILVQSGLAGAISLIPFGVGSAINEMLTKLALRRTHERMEEMFDEMARHINDLGEKKIDRDWFRGEEFQTLLFEVLHQLHVTQDKQKIEMMGKALANSGSTDFKEESRKELFLQLVRDLTPQHVTLLRRLAPDFAEPGMSQDRQNLWLWQQRPQITGDGSDLLILQMLAANGLVEESLKTVEVREPNIGSYSSQGQIQNAIKEFIRQLQKPPERCFCLSKLGMDFLRFVGLDNEKSGSKPESTG